MKQQPEHGLANSQNTPPPMDLPWPGPRLAPPQAVPAPVPGPDFPERLDDPAQAEELERQQDA